MKSTENDDELGLFLIFVLDVTCPFMVPFHEITLSTEIILIGGKKCRNTCNITDLGSHGNLNLGLEVWDISFLRKENSTNHRSNIFE